MSSAPEPAPGAEFRPSGSRPGLRRAVFVDRDGTLNVDLRYLSDPSKLELYRGVGQGVRLLNQHHFLVICVTNQSGIGRGLYTESSVIALHARLQELLAREGAHLDGVYFCPHAPEAGCACRKPGVALFQQAAEDFGIHLPSSAIIGDRQLDVQAGRTLGLLTAYVPEPGRETAYAEDWKATPVVPDIRAESFMAACHRVLARG